MTVNVDLTLILSCNSVCHFIYDSRTVISLKAVYLANGRIDMS